MDPASPRRVLLVYDGSSVAERALGVAIERARKADAIVTVLAVIPPRLWRAKRGQFQIPPDKHDEDFARDQVHRAKDACFTAGVRSEGRVRAGPPIDVISEEAEAGYEAVVLASRPNLTGGPTLASLVDVPDGCELVVVT